MLNEMIERVAIAIFNNFCPAIAYLEEDKKRYEEAARAAIEAMREPTEEMLKVNTGSIWYGAEEIWKSFIDAALKE